MVESMYQKWLNVEKEWIGGYCTRTRKSSLLKVTPLTLVLSALLFGGIAFLGSGNMEDMFIGGIGGLFFGFIFCVFYLVILFFNLRPGRYVRKIRQSVEDLSMSEIEKEQLGREMLDALEHEEQVLSYQIVGPNSNGTPARLIRTPHYVFQEGSAPYAILVRMSDIAEVKAGSERKIAATHRAKTKTYHHFTLYSIGFYRKDRFERGLSDSELPDYAMGFFQKSLRDDALELVQHDVRGEY